MKPTYFDLTVRDLGQARSFFESVLGWRFEKFKMPYDYYRIKAGSETEPGIDGGIGSIKDAPLSGGNPVTQITVPVPNLDEVLSLVQASGGRVVEPKMPIPGVGWYATCAEPGVLSLELFRPTSARSSQHEAQPIKRWTFQEYLWRHGRVEATFCRTEVDAPGNRAFKAVPIVAAKLMENLMKTFSVLSRATLLIAACALPIWAEAQNVLKNTAASTVWPSKPVHLLVGFPGGSTPDMVARTLAEPLAKALGQPVIIENRPGASGNIAADQVAKATDDHTLGVAINGNLTSAKQLFPKLPYDPARDFAPISLLTTAPLVLVAPASQPGGAEFFAAARQGGGQWNYGSVGNGSVGHLGMELIKSRMPGVTPVHVPYAGNPQVVTAMLGGQIQMALIPPGVAMPHVRSGKLRAIGLAGGRSALVPEVPPLAEAGVQNVNLEVWTALIGPASLSKAAQARLSQEVPRIMRDAETRQKLFNQGWQAVGTSPDGLKSRIKDEAAILGNIIQTRGIKIE